MGTREKANQRFGKEILIEYCARTNRTTDLTVLIVATYPGKARHYPG